jgi:hypothetical protein
MLVRSIPHRANRRPAAPTRAHLILRAMVLAYAAVYSTLDAILHRYHPTPTSISPSSRAAWTDPAADVQLDSRHGLAWRCSCSSLFLIAPLYAVARHP